MSVGMLRRPEGETPPIGIRTVRAFHKPSFSLIIYKSWLDFTVSLETPEILLLSYLLLVTMPVGNYGVWKAKPIRYTYETREDDPRSPHLSLFFDDDELNNARAAINIKSGDGDDSRLVFWPVTDFQHPLIHELGLLDIGFHGLTGTDEQGPNSLALDYIRSNLFPRRTGRLLPHDIPGANNDIIDVLKPILDRAIGNGATIFLYGSRFGDGKGIHNVHMNQGNPQQWAHDNGVYQDGGFILQFENHWEAGFIGFASQAVHTVDNGSRSGQPTPSTGYLTWAHFLDPETSEEGREENELFDRPVVITKALVNPKGLESQPGIAPETVTLSNRTTAAVNLAGWTIRNKMNQLQRLPGDAILLAGRSTRFEVLNCPLSNQGGTITLLNAQGLMVHGVSYSRMQACEEGVEIPFTSHNMVMGGVPGSNRVGRKIWHL
jgi:uncharacterized protein YukJ